MRYAERRFSSLISIRFVAYATARITKAIFEIIELMPPEAELPQMPAELTHDISAATRDDTLRRHAALSLRCPPPLLPPYAELTDTPD